MSDNNNTSSFDIGLGELRLDDKEEELVNAISDEGKRQELKDILLKKKKEQIEFKKEQIEFKKEQIEFKKKSSGEYWTPLDVLYGTQKTSSEGGFSAICGRIGNETWKKIRPKEYGYIERDLTEKMNDNNIAADDLSLQTSKDTGSAASDSSNSKSSTKDCKKSSNNKSKSSNRHGKKGEGGTVPRNRLAKYQPNTPIIKRDFMGYPDGDDAHLFPRRSTSCIPRYGILSQPVVGCDFEVFFEEKKENSDKKEKEKLKKILQLAVLSPAKPIGISSLRYNLFPVPKAGHLNHFDNGCRWFFVPVMTLQDVLEWKEGSGYTVMAIAGNMQDDDNNPSEEDRYYTSSEVYLSLLKADVLEKDNHRLLDEQEVKEATDLLTAIVKGLADMVAGRGEKKLTPKMLGRQDAYNDLELDQKLALENGEKELLSGSVTVPKLQWKPGTNVLGVELFRSDTDPLLLAIKSANNWMAQIGEKAVPGCEDRSNDDASSSELDDGEFVVPSTPKVPEFIQFETPVVIP